MITILREASVFQGEQLYDESSLSEEHTLFRFCQFVDYYTRHSTDPLYTAAVCERQAEDLHINPQDVNRESIRLLIATMLNAIDHLEKKWLDEQLQREEQEQSQYEEQTPRLVLPPKQEKHRLKHLFQTWVQGSGNMVKGGVACAR